MPIDVAAVSSVPECVLDSATLAGLPVAAPPAPWSVKARGMFWWSRPTSSAQQALRDLLPDALGTGLQPVFVVGALISYERTPVGPYHEVIGIVSARRGARVVTHVPFIAVDSKDSLVGGRANWALPKTLADFEGEPEDSTPMSASGRGWEITATPVTSGPRLPFGSPPLASLVQIGAGSQRWKLRGSGYGWVRLARVEVGAYSNGSLATWFPTGGCRGVLSPVMHGRMGPAVAC